MRLCNDKGGAKFHSNDFHTILTFINMTPLTTKQV